MTDLDANRVETMLRTAKTRADLQDLVRSLDARNVQLQRGTGRPRRTANASALEGRNITMTDNNITLTAKEYVTLKSFRAHSRKWEDRAKESSKALEESRTALGAVTEDRDAWENRARYNLAQAQILEKLNDKLVSRIERFTR